MLYDKVGVVVEGVVRTKEGDWQPWRRHSTNKELAAANSLKGWQGLRWQKTSQNDAREMLSMGRRRGKCYSPQVDQRNPNQ